MKIEIEYEASWRNSFLDPSTSNNEPLPKGGRKFIASSTNLNGKDKEKYFIERKVTVDTVMGILNRLIGEQRKLYQARQDKNYYFKDIEIGFHKNIHTFDDIDSRRIESKEIVYLRNRNNSDDRNSFTGMIKTNDYMFTSDYSKEFWGTLNLDFSELISFIIYEKKVDVDIDLNPIEVANRLAEIDKMKFIEKTVEIEKVLNIFNNLYPEIEYLDKKERVKPMWVYCTALYLQYERLSKIYNTESILTKRGAITGISKKSFTKKQFMERYTTGKMKKIFGNPYSMEVFTKGEGKSISMLTKASGVLEIIIDIPRDEAKALKKMIENAGVSSFYLGKKGLAYVINMDTREVKKK